MTQAPWQQVPAPQQGQPNGYPQPGPQSQQPWQQAPVAPPQGPPGGYPPAPQGPANGYQPQAQQPWQQAPQAPPAAPQQQAQAQEEGDDEFFTSGTGGSYMSFADDACVGHPRGGEIVGINEQQQTHKDTKEPMFWPNSDRKIMIKVVTMQTNERRPGDQEDTGLRSVWLPQSKDITKAVIEAMKQSSPNELRLKIGGQLWITRTGSRPTTQKNGGRGFPAFTYIAQYVPPQGNDAFFGGAGPMVPPAVTPPPPNGSADQFAAYAQYQKAQEANQSAPNNQVALWQQPAAPVQQTNPYAGQQLAQPAYQAVPNGQPAGQPNGQAPWQQAPAPQGAQPSYISNSTQSVTGYASAPNDQAPWPQAPWAQPGVQQATPPQGTYQPPAPDPANPWGNQPQQRPGPNPYPQQ